MDEKKTTLTPEAQLLKDGITAVIKTSRWAYEAAIAEGFSPAESLQISIAYMTALTTAATGTKK